MAVPVTRYAESGGVNIAYQVFGASARPKELVLEGRARAHRSVARPATGDRGHQRLTKCRCVRDGNIPNNWAESRCVMGLFSVVGKQLQHPRGLVGKVLFRWMASATVAHARWTADLMEVCRDDEIVEIGFGNGANIGLLATRASDGHVTGVEVSETAMEMASKNNAAAISDGRVELHLVTPGAALPIDDATFDKACTVATMYVIEDAAAVFTEMYRVLKPGGLAAVTFPVRENFMRFKPAKTEGFHFHELADLEAAFRDAGFAETRTERNDEVRFGAHSLLGRKPTANTEPIMSRD